MDIKKYEQHTDFDRNEALFVLHTIDKTPLEELAKNFNLAIEEIKVIRIIFNNSNDLELLRNGDLIFN